MSSLTPVAHDLDHRWHYLASEQLQHECPAWSTAHSSFCTHLTCTAICQWLSALCTVAVERPFFPVSTERRSLVRDHQITISVYRLVFAPIINSCRLCLVQEAFCMHVVDLYFLQLVHVVHCISFSAYEWARLVSSAIYNILGCALEWCQCHARVMALVAIFLKWVITFSADKLGGSTFFKDIHHFCLKFYLPFFDVGATMSSESS